MRRLHLPRRYRLAFLALLAGCHVSAAPVSLAPPVAIPTAADYSRLLATWTRHGTAVRHFETTLEIHATLRSPAFNAAFVAKQERMFRLPPERVAEVRREGETLWHDAYPFTVVAAAHDMEWNDLDRPQSQWRLWLLGASGQRVAPLEIKLTRLASASDRELYPHLGDFYRLYQVRFPRQFPDGSPVVTDATERLVLEVSGPLGAARLEWRLK